VGSARATALGAIAVLLWAALALLTVGAKRLPPFQLLALTFGIAAAPGFALAILRKRSPWREARRWPTAFVLVTAALAGYHFSYFVALRNAPAVDASLIAYLWPLLIVVFAGLAHGGVRAAHLLGGALGLAGAWLVIAARGPVELRADYFTGYAAAAACALIWSAYSVANRRYAAAPVDVVTLACLATAAFGAVAHFAFEEAVTPTPGEWLAIALLGLGPVGAAFFLWDYGTKHGRLALLGVLAYAAPVLSTLLLVASGQEPFSWAIAAAALLVAGGAALASTARK
jgi:drug/metabolite transporter (DMT)-like permease